LELRYFVAPYLIWRLNIATPSKVQLFLEGTAFKVVAVDSRHSVELPPTTLILPQI
jgi:hypothetical protein